MKMKTKSKIEFIFHVWIFILMLPNFYVSLQLDTEHLHVQQLSSKFVYYHFSFNISSTLENQQHLLQDFKYKIEEYIDAWPVEFALTRGRWNQKKWGSMDIDLPIGTYIKAISSQENFEIIHRILGTLFCVSTNSNNFFKFYETLESHLTTNGENKENFITWHTFNTDESTCKENFSTFIKLLPCYGKEGVSSLIKSINLLNSFYSSLYLSLNQNFIKIDMRIVLEEKLNKENLLNLENRFKSSIKKSCPWTKESLFTYVTSKEPNFDIFERMELKNIFQNHCFDSKHNIMSTFTVLNPIHLYYSSINPVNSGTTMLIIYNLKSVKLNRIASLETGKLTEIYLAPLKMQSFQNILWVDFECNLNGHLHDKNYIECSIYPISKVSTHDTIDLFYHIQLLLGIPWIADFYLHSIYVYCDESKVSEKEDVYYDIIYYSPPQRKSSMGYLKLKFRVTSCGKVKFKIKIKRKFLKFDEFPPDAYRGFVLPPVTLFLQQISNNESNIINKVQYSKAFVLHLPTPDFTMPYNVLCLTCTILALSINTVHRICTKCIEVIEDESKMKHIYVRFFIAAYSKFKIFGLCILQCIKFNKSKKE
ncbi:GPI transamidase component PIG-T [Intoshia linei]|uniref:GPI transamidase component PIG-T n=1 Tax=Intoshia linei TaxID=1819745 RepID=A0A177B725_9BILA|nr:GPI transamidase component PIG-T [Intoshia linei]